MITLYVAVSLDGFLHRLGVPGHAAETPSGSREQDELAFLHQPGRGREDDDYGYEAFYRTVDCVVMGRRTWSVVKGFTPFLYADKACVVITRNPTLEAVANETFRAFDPAYWRERGQREHVYLAGGGVLVAEFMRHGLIDRLELATIPVVLGAGQALFPRGIPHTQFTLEKVVGHASGITQASYRLATR